MPRTRPPYPQEFREQIIALARAGRSVRELSEEFEPSAEIQKLKSLAKLKKSCPGGRGKDSGSRP